MAEHVLAALADVRVGIALVPLLPMLACVIIGLATFARPQTGGLLTERAVARIAISSLAASLVLTLILGARWLAAGAQPTDVSLGAWFRLRSGGFELGVLLDGLSLAMLTLTGTITVLVARFSVRYLHREPGFARFFLLVCLFATGMHVLVLAGSYDLLFAGWELVGISTMLLVAFYHHRLGPTRAAVRTMITYRVADVGLLVAGVLLHHHAGSSELADAFGAVASTHLTADGATWVALALLLATMGKSAQFPFGGWLPRAMEGPTPSSALFYGALSVHAGVYLLLRSAPLFEASAVASVAVAAVGALTAVHATMVGRTQSDAKSALAYATMTQVGLMLVEIGLHLWTWALVHMIAHVSLRLFQLLRTPSALRDAQEIRAALAAAPAHRPGLWTRLVSEPTLARLYHLSRHRFYVDDLLERGLIAPAIAASRSLDALERRLVAALSGWPRAHDGAELHHPSRSDSLRATAAEGERSARAGESRP